MNEEGKEIPYGWSSKCKEAQLTVERTSISGVYISAQNDDDDFGN